MRNGTVVRGRVPRSTDMNISGEHGEAKLMLERSLCVFSC